MQSKAAPESISEVVPEVLGSDIQIKFSNMEASKISSSYLNKVFKEIQNEAPAGAVIEAQISYQENFFKGIVRVRSSDGPFFGHVAADNIEDLGQKLLEQMKKRLTRWKEKHH